VSQKVFPFRIVRIEVQHQEIQSPFCFLVSLLLLTVYYGFQHAELSPHQGRL
jgi:hypothetical protein